MTNNQVIEWKRQQRQALRDGDIELAEELEERILDAIDARVD